MAHGVVAGRAAGDSHGAESGPDPREKDHDRDGSPARGHPSEEREPPEVRSAWPHRASNPIFEDKRSGHVSQVYSAPGVDGPVGSLAVDGPRDGATRWFRSHRVFIRRLRIHRTMSDEKGSVRVVEERYHGLEAIEGAGVRLHRLFGHAEVPRLDPFLLLDHFRSSDPADYVAGFPWHPHRGIETVTYMLNGQVDHGDSLGNSGTIDSGDVQWMSSGSGILHQEMPRRMDGTLEGFQLWVNMPANSKMTTPEYRGVRGSQFPDVHDDAGSTVKVVAGEFQGTVGPVDGLPIDPTYLDVTVRPDETFRAPTVRGHTTFAYPTEGSARFDPTESEPLSARQVAVYGDGDSVEVRAGPEGVRFLLVSGRPLREPVAWYGPIVMNRQDELQEAIRELRRGDFIKTKKPIIDE